MNISQACRHVKRSRALKAISRKKDYKHTQYFLRKQYYKQETDLWNRSTALKRASKKTDLISKKASSFKRTDLRRKCRELQENNHY
jgi:hypothetical protein